MMLDATWMALTTSQEGKLEMDVFYNCTFFLRSLWIDWAVCYIFNTKEGLNFPQTPLPLPLSTLNY